MSDTFNDGDPIDASLLQKLKSDVAKATALAGAKVSAGSSISIENSTAAVLTPPKFFGGITRPKPVTTAAGGTEFVIDYSRAGFTVKPSAIMLTAVSANGLESMYAPSIISGTVTEKGARAQIRAYGVNKSISLYFVAIQNQA